MKVAVLGAGSWGTTLAARFAPKVPTVLWARDSKLVDQLVQTRRNNRYLPELQLPSELDVTDAIEKACDKAELVIFAVPSHGMREIAKQAAGFLVSTHAVMSVSKGIEQHTMCRMTEVLAEELPEQDPGMVGLLTGPTLAVEIAAGQPAAAVVAFRNEEVAMWAQDLLRAPTLRIYTNPDVVGCELAGALKNVMAIAVGAAAGMGLGDSACAALITRGLAEMTRLGVALGGESFTFAGLAGMGDLIVTCTSEKSRNRNVGFQLGQARKLEDITAGTHMIAEGVRTTLAVLELAEREGVEMPITRAVGSVLYDGRTPMEAMFELMARQAKSEVEGII